MTTDDYMEENWNLSEHDNLSVNSNFTSEYDPDLGVITVNLAA